MPFSQYNRALFLIIIFLPLFLLAHDKDCTASIDNFDIDFEYDTLILEYEEMPNTIIRITDDYKLFINGAPVELNEEQADLVKDYYLQMEDITSIASKLGYEGSKIGINGLKLGAKSIIGIFKLLSDDYDSDDLERDLEKDKEVLVKNAQRLKKQGKKLKAMAEELKNLHCRLFTEVKELNALIEGKETD